MTDLSDSEWTIGSWTPLQSTMPFQSLGWTDASNHLTKFVHSRQSMPIQAVGRLKPTSLIATKLWFHRITAYIDLFVCCWVSRTHQARLRAQQTWFCQQSSGNSLLSMLKILLYYPSQFWDVVVACVLICVLKGTTDGTRIWNQTLIGGLQNFRNPIGV